jgi:hypothetical protein
VRSRLRKEPSSSRDSGQQRQAVSAHRCRSDNQNLKLIPYIEKKVKVSGTSPEKGDVKGIAIKTVEAAE